jgi:hypothetical protein
MTQTELFWKLATVERDLERVYSNPSTAEDHQLDETVELLLDQLYSTYEMLCRSEDAAVREQRIREAAYFNAERRGFAPGGELADWLAAERALSP